MQSATVNQKLLAFQEQIKKTPVGVKEMPLSALAIENFGGENLINIKDNNGVSKLFRANNRTIKSLTALLGLGDNLLGNLEQGIGKEAASRILGIIKLALSKNQKNVRLIINFATREVEDIIEKAPSFLSSDLFLKVVEDKLGNNTDIINYGVGSDGTQSITFKSDMWGFKLPGKSDEEFHLGMLFNNSPVTGTEVMPYFYRLICTNGMVGGRGIESMRLALTGSKEEDILNFIRGVDGLNFNRYEPSEFGKRVSFMENTRASLREVYQMKKLANEKANLGGVPKEELAILNVKLEDYFPTAGLEALYYKKGYDLSTYSMRHFANIKSEITAWDLLNNLTDFATHDYGFNINQHDLIKLQGVAGEYMAKKNFDTEFLMPQFGK